VLAFNRAAIEDKMGRLAAWLDLPDASYQGVLDWVLGLRRDLKIPHTLAELGVGTDRLEELATAAAQDPTAGTNPIPLDPGNLETLFVSALEGRIG
jgi:alcohol dehydrogenase class IV